MSLVFSSGDDNSKNGTETVVRVMITQMTKSIKLTTQEMTKSINIVKKKLVKSEDWILISIWWWLTRDQR